MTGHNPTAARNAYLAQVLANPPAHRQPCAAGCGQPLTSWHVDAQGRHWHPDCLPPGTPMPITRSDREWQKLLNQARATNQRLNKRAQEAESKLATYGRAVGEWQLTDKATYVPLRSITAIAKAAGLEIDPDRYEMHYQRVEHAEAEATQLRAGLEDLFTRWFLNAHAGLDFREAMMGIAAEIRAILDKEAS